MFKKFLTLLSGFCIPLFILAQGHTTISANTPRIVIGIVIEDFNPDYIERYWEKFGDGGFQRLYSKGYICANHHYDNLLQRPSVNMATLSTGTTPSRHGIVNDFWIDRLKKKEVNAVNDDTYTTVGSDSKEGERSAMKLMSPTLGDQLKLITKGKSRVFSIALNDISAVFAAGHAADGAYWFDSSSGKMISSSYFVGTFPKWAFDYNGLKMADSYFRLNWTPFKEQISYTESISDLYLKETGYLGKYNTFPFDMSKLKRESGGSYKILKTTPWGNTIVKDFAIQMIPKERLGYDLIPDLLTVVFSSMDYERYSFGPFSAEMQDTYLRLDKDIAELLKYLEDGYGTDNILVYLTGLTSISYPAEYLKEKYRMTAGIFNPESSIALLKSYLNIKYGDGNWIELFTNQQIYLDHELIEKQKVNLLEIQVTVASFLNQFEGIAYAKAAKEIEADNFPGGLLEPFQNNYHIKRSGDVLIKYEDGWQPKDKFSPVDYTDNTQVPLVWFGNGITKGTTLRRTNATDIVPTIAAFLGIAPPSSVTGKVIDELIKH
ncbi:MAG: alkaline phosphatase family protein [Bacteroidia bacterium]|nr:alkaline phosphatase family protein [Bacteroidia bacterium]